jgi:hypothetical protein
MLLDIGGIVINLDNLVSFKIDNNKDVYYLQIFMLDGTGYNIAYDNIEHMLRDIKSIQNATKRKK